MGDVDLSVFTLNCWGLPGVSAHRSARVRAIAEHLAAAGHDLVLLQEVWLQSDYRTICRVTRDVLPYRHFFHQGIVGTGTCVLSREPVTDAVFHEFSMNGYPHRILHGDWWAGKGLGVVVLDYRGLNIHVFVSHLHAEYCRRKDIYLGHRVLQALEAAQWVRLTAPGADLTIYGGDFNTEPGDVPYRLLRCVGGLRDCWEEAHGPGGGQTCGTEYNSFCTIAEQADYPRGKRIDYLLVAPGRRRALTVRSCTLPLPRTIPASLACNMAAPCSYSDHEAVTAQLRVGSEPGGAGDGSSGPGEQESQGPALAAALGLLAEALRSVARDQRLYALLAALAALGFTATFGQLLAADTLLLEGGVFLLRLIATLAGLYWALMATVFNRRERHALQAGRAALVVLQARAPGGYGAL